MDDILVSENIDKNVVEKSVNLTEIIKESNGSDLDVTWADIVIDRVRSVTLKVPICIEDQKVSAVVDTGAEVTVMSENLFFRIPEERRPKLQEAKRNLVVAEAGKRMKTLGVAEVSVTLGPSEFSWSIYVAPIGDNLLLGCDVIDEMNITINTKRGLEVQGVWIECDVDRKSDQVARILLHDTVTIPPNSEVVIEGIADNSKVIDTRYGSIEPVFENALERLEDDADDDNDDDDDDDDDDDGVLRNSMCSSDENWNRAGFPEEHNCNLEGRNIGQLRYVNVPHFGDGNKNVSMVPEAGYMEILLDFGCYNWKFETRCERSAESGVMDDPLLLNWKRRRRGC